MMQESSTFNHTAFFEGLSTHINTLKGLRKAYDEQMAFDFISTRFFHPNENKFSEILAFFLEPTETHGQGDTFLRIFCEKFLGDCDWETRIDKSVTVLTEHITNEKRRIDITVELGGQFIVGVENKIYNWTAEQPDQAKHYCEYMQETHKDNFLLLYLTPDGEIPSKHSIDEDFRKKLEGADVPQFRCISYRSHILTLLEQWATTCKAPVVEAFLRDFKKYIQYQYIGVQDMTVEQFIADYLVQNNQYMEVALRIHQNIDVVRQELWNKSREQFKAYFKDREGSASICEWERGGWNKGIDILKISDTKDRWSWFLKFDAGQCNQLYCGVQPDELESWNLEELEKHLPDSYYDVKEDNVNGWAPKDQYRYHWLTSMQPWEDMACKTNDRANNKFVDTVITWYEEAREAVEKFRQTEKL